MDEYEVVTGGDQEDTYRVEKRKWLEPRSSMGGGNELLNKFVKVGHCLTMTVG